MLRVVPARDGSDTVIWEGVHIHSVYSPAQEVSRFIESTISGNPNTILLLGETLGYLAREIQNRYSRTRVIVALYNDQFRRTFSMEGVDVWYPGIGASLIEFLASHVSDIEMSGLVVISWPGADRVFPDISGSCLRSVRRFIGERTGSLLTTGGFGRSWIRNAFVNFLCSRTLRLLGPPPNEPVVIVASGASLSYLLPLLKESRRRIRIWALPSALDALIWADIVPDLVVLTDPGHYSYLHLRPLETTQLPLAMPLTAARGSWKTESYLFSQGSFLERAIFARLSIPPPVILPATGTVTATALLLGLAGSATKIFLIGMDLCSIDIKDHVLPGGFYSLYRSSEDRFKPLLATQYERVVQNGKRVQEGWQSPQLECYANWISRQAWPGGREIYRVAPTSVELPSIASIDFDEATTLLSTLPELSDWKTPMQTASDADLALPKRSRCMILKDIVSRWDSILMDAKMPIGLPGRIDVIPEEVGELLSLLSMVEYLSFCRIFNCSSREELALKWCSLIDESRETLFSITRKLLK